MTLTISTLNTTLYAFILYQEVNADPLTGPLTIIGITHHYGI